MASSGIVKIELCPEIRQRIIEQLRARAAEALGVGMPDNWPCGDGDEITLAQLTGMAASFNLQIIIDGIKLVPLQKKPIRKGV